MLSGSFRQVSLFGGMKIMAIEEFHDAAKMRAFWKMVRSDEATLVTSTKEN